MSKSIETSMEATQTDSCDREDDARKYSDEYPREWHKTSIVALHFVLAMTANYVVLMIVHDLSPRHEVSPDIIFHLFPPQKWANVLVDVVMNVQVVLATLLCVIFHKHGHVIFRRWAFMMSVIYFMRFMCLTVTQFPTPLPHSQCAPISHDTTFELIFNRVFNVSVLFRSTSGSTKPLEAPGEDNEEGLLMCGDVMYSGHTIMLSMSCFILHEYTPNIIWPLRWLVIPLNGICLLTLSLGRLHYTADVLVSYLLCTLTFSVYHAYVETPHRARKRSTAFRRLYFMYWRMMWIEENVPAGYMENKLDWPFDRPLFMKELFAKIPQGD